MNFRTEYIPQKSEYPLDPEWSVVLIGSCFTDSIGALMRQSRWRAFPNICGVLYNPASIAMILELAAEHQSLLIAEIIDQSIIRNGEIWNSWLMDSGVSGYSRDHTIQKVTSRLCRLASEIANAQVLIVTFGTAWIYALSDNPDYIVANCHKFPSGTFTRRRMSVEEISVIWMKTIGKLRELNPGLRIILTVSPIRHLKDGFEGNSRSKATLLLACERICDENPDIEYFPSFEILNDDLRDYRFYSDDLVHPSPQGVGYIWDKFCQRFLTEESRALLTEGERITRSLAHRPIINDGSDTASRHAAELRDKALARYREFMGQHPGMLEITD